MLAPVIIISTAGSCKKTQVLLCTFFSQAITQFAYKKIQLCWYKEMFLL
jgi:hypothetical protein